MEVKHIDHYTLCCMPEELPQLRRFYGDIIGLTEGARPDFSFAGHWMYAGGRPIVHLAALPGACGEIKKPMGNSRGFDHVSFRVSGLQTTRAKLRQLGVRFAEAPVPDFPLHQLFLRDPMGVKVELTFDMAEVPMDDPARSMSGDAAMIDI